MNGKYGLRLSFTCVSVFLICGALYAGPKGAGSKEDGIFATLQTSRGNIKIKFFFKQTPLTVCNFVGLAEGTIKNTAKPLGTPYFDGMKWHRVVANWVIQSGDPTGTGSGDPGYEFPCEIDTPSLIHDSPGVVGMANSGAGTVTNGSQFYITHGGGETYKKLNGGYTIFGHTVDSADMKVVNAIKQGDGLLKVTIERIGAEAMAFKTDQKAFDSLLKMVTGTINDLEKQVPSPLFIKARDHKISIILQNQQVIDLNIYTISGRKICSIHNTLVSHSFSIPYIFKSGIYFIDIQAKGARYRKKCIVK